MGNARGVSLVNPNEIAGLPLLTPTGYRGSVNHPVGEYKHLVFRHSPRKRCALISHGTGKCSVGASASVWWLQNVWKPSGGALRPQVHTSCCDSLALCLARFAVALARGVTASATGGFEVRTAARAQASHNKKAMGKKNWSITHYRAAETELGERPKVKISVHCDPYDANANFAGIIIYASKGSFKWTKDQTVTGWDGRFAYVMIKDTGKWIESEFNQAGQGRVHDAMFKKVMKGSYTDNMVRGMMKATAVPSQSH